MTGPRHQPLSATRLTAAMFGLGAALCAGCNTTWVRVEAGNVPDPAPRPIAVPAAATVPTAEHTTSVAGIEPAAPGAAAPVAPPPPVVVPAPAPVLPPAPGGPEVWTFDGDAEDTHTTPFVRPVKHAVWDYARIETVAVRLSDGREVHGILQVRNDRSGEGRLREFVLRGPDAEVLDAVFVHGRVVTRVVGRHSDGAPVVTVTWGRRPPSPTLGDRQ